MKIGITNDHRGVKLKKKLIAYLTKKGYEVIDYGPNTEDPVDYPIYAFDIGKRINNKEIEIGILICGTGTGMCIAANKVKGIRCAKVETVKEAKLAREHNNANSISISAGLSLIRIKDILDVFLKTGFSNEERHIRRIKMIDDYNEESNDN